MDDTNKHVDAIKSGSVSGEHWPIYPTSSLSMVSHWSPYFKNIPQNPDEDEEEQRKIQEEELKLAIRNMEEQAEAWEDKRYLEKKEDNLKKWKT